MARHKTDDLHMRMRPSVKAALKEAARRRGKNVTEFLTDLGLREAGVELARQHRDEESESE